MATPVNIESTMPTHTKLASLVLTGLVASNDLLISKNEASKFLEHESVRVRRAPFFGSGRSKLPRQIKEHKREYPNVCSFNNVEVWETFKNELEETALPEEQVDALESCVFWCRWTDPFKDATGGYLKFLGVNAGYEEIREDQEEDSTQFVPACAKCLDKLPEGDSRFRTGLKDHFRSKPPCVNREFWNILGPKYGNGGSAFG